MSTADPVEFPECMPGCSCHRHAHQHGASTDTQDAAQSIGEIRGNLYRLASDIQNGDLHCGNFDVWLAELQASLEGRMGGSAQAEVGNLHKEAEHLRDLTHQFRVGLQGIATETRTVAGKL